MEIFGWMVLGGCIFFLAMIHAVRIGVKEALKEFKEEFKEEIIKELEHNGRTKEE